MQESLNFQFTMNFGQLLQIISILGPFCIWFWKYSTAHTIMKLQIQANGDRLKKIEGEVNEMKGVLYSLPSMMVSLHRTPKNFDNGEKAYSQWDKAFTMPDDVPEGIQHLLEGLNRLTEKGK